MHLQPIKSHSEDSGILQFNPYGTGPVVFVCEHANNFIPEEFMNLGLDSKAQASHIAWDLGALPVAKALAVEFDGILLAPGVSRLVCDCNRPTTARNAVLERSEGYDIPGNMGLSDAERTYRAERYHIPYHNALASSIETALSAGRLPAVVSIHSFTPVYHGVPRAFDLGILHDRDSRLANEIFALANSEGDLAVCMNEPYDADDGVTFTLAEHALPRGLLNVMIEIRNDLIEDAPSQKAMAERLAGYMKFALKTLGDGRAPKNDR